MGDSLNKVIVDYAQLQEGLKYDLMKAPVVSGALNYHMCFAWLLRVRNEDWQSLKSKGSISHPTSKSREKLLLSLLAWALTGVPRPASPSRDLAALAQS